MTQLTIDSEQFDQLILQRLPTLMRQNPQIQELVLDLARQNFADRKETDTRFYELLGELKRDREEQSRKWEEWKQEWKEYTQEQNRKWEEQSRKWEEHNSRLKEESQKWEEQNRRWDEQNLRLKEESQKWEEQNRRWNEQSLRLKEESQKWEEQNRRWEEQSLRLKEESQKWEEQNRRWDEQNCRLKEENQKWEEQNRRWDEQNLRLKEESQKWEEQNRRWNEQNHKWEEQNRRWDEQNHKWEEQNRKWEDAKHQFDRMHEAIMAIAQKHDRSIGALGSRWGIQAENAFRNALAGILEKSFGVQVLNINEYDDEGMVFGRPDQVELDVIIKNGLLIICEIKSSIDKAGMYIFERKVRFYEKKHQRKADRMLVISPMIDAKAEKVAEKLGIERYSDSIDVKEL